MRGMRGAGWVITIIAVLAALPMAAQARCFFLECGPGDDATPIAPRPMSPGSPPDVIPRARVPRPSSASEVCQLVADGHTYCVSSVLAPQYGFTYNPINLTDGRLDTAWVEGKPGDGIGEWIVVVPSAGKRVLGFEILNGYHKNKDLFLKNGRVKELEVILPTGHRQTITLADQAGPQRIMFPRAASVEWVQLRIRSVYLGTKYQDTAITELHLLAD